MANKDDLIKQVTEKLEQKYNLEGINSIHIALVELPEKNFKNFFIVFHPKGATVYDYTSDEQLEEYGSLLWEEFSEMTIKHFDLKSVISFYAADRLRRVTLVDGTGEEVETFIKEHTPVQLKIIEQKWYNKIPGFRSETRWKMITSAIVYLWVIGLMYNLIVS